MLLRGNGMDKKVFISYSHKDKDWVANWLLPKFKEAGVEVHIDYKDFEFGVASIVNMERAVERCAKTLLVLSSHWVNSEFSQFEGVMVQTEDPLGLKKRILPLKLDDCVLPRRLKILSWADFREEDQWESQIERVIAQIRKDFGEVEGLAVEYPPLGKENIDIERLPEIEYKLFGRQKELGILNKAWESGDTNVLSFVAWGGVGKSALVNKWLEKMRWDNYRGAKKVFGWSFYSQGTKERVTSADKFISDALEWFGDPDPTEGSIWDKGRRLADLVRKERTLLILDGLEPLQSGLDIERGKIKDPALSILVTQLARKNNGLCVITTREKVAELGRFDKGVEQLGLEQISKEAGRALLRVGGVQGDDAELEAASEEFGNHALAVNLLAAYLHDIKGHHIKNAGEIGDLDIPVEKGRHPRRVIEAFEERLGEGGPVQLLRILGLFDRPAEIAAIEAVYGEPAIAGLTDKLQGLSEGQRDGILEELRGFKLIAKKSGHRPDVVDCHPLVREHFGEKLKTGNRDGWREAHGRLYEYYKGVPEKELPDTLAEMEPLFAAVGHGCQAGRYQEALHEVYYPRLLRGNEYYVVKKLGAFGAWLAVLLGFFEKAWSGPVSELKERDQALVLNGAGTALRALGRLREGGEAMEAGMEFQIQQKDWVNVAIAGENLSELYLVLGSVEAAVDYGRGGVEYADRSDAEDSWENKVRTRSALADALHQAGAIGEARGLFEEAEGMQKEEQPGHPLLYSLRGFQFCDLLLSEGGYEAVEERTTGTIKIAERNKWLLDMALDKLSLGRAYLLEAVSGRRQKTGDRRQEGEDRKTQERLKEAGEYLTQAVDGLREAGTQQFMPLGLLGRAEYYRYAGEYERAWGDLGEAREIAERGEMGLWLADCCLEGGRVCLAQVRGGAKQEIVPFGGYERVEMGGGEILAEARKYFEKAASEVDEMGYHRRGPEVLLIEAEVLTLEGKKEKGKKTFEKAKARIDEMGCHRWDSEVERISNIE